MATKKTRLNHIGKFLNQVGREYWNEIPLGSIFNKLEDNGFLVLQEDGTKWDGFLCGAEGEAAFDLCDLDKNAGYYYLYQGDDLIGASRLPKIAGNISLNREVTSNSGVWNIVTKEISKAEYETFQVMGCQDAPVYDEDLMCFTPCNHRLILTWYKMTSGRYEVVAYVS